MNETLDQHDAHSPPLPPTGWRHAAHNGGRAVSSTNEGGAGELGETGKAARRLGWGDGHGGQGSPALTDVPAAVSA